MVVDLAVLRNLREVYGYFSQCDYRKTRYEHAIYTLYTRYVHAMYTLYTRYKYDINML